MIIPASPYAAAELLNPGNALIKTPAIRGGRLENSGIV
jgi:hypothetical protein